MIYLLSLTLSCRRRGIPTRIDRLFPIYSETLSSCPLYQSSTKAAGKKMFSIHSQNWVASVIYFFKCLNIHQHTRQNIKINLNKWVFSICNNRMYDKSFRDRQQRIKKLYNNQRKRRTLQNTYISLMWLPILRQYVLKCLELSLW